jgi:ABC-type amino acid transport substrate-binding protein
MTKPKLRIISNDADTFDFVVSAYGFPKKDVASYEAFVDINNGRSSITINVNDADAFIETLTKAVAQARAKGEAEAAKYGKIMEKWSKEMVEVAN